MSGPEHNPMDDVPAAREEHEAWNRQAALERDIQALRGVIQNMAATQAALVEALKRIEEVLGYLRRGYYYPKSELDRVESQATAALEKAGVKA